MNFPTGNDRVPNFPWGPVVQVHEIPGLDLIIEHHPQIFKNCAGTNRYEKKKVVFTVALSHEGSSGISWEGYETLDKAIVAVLANKYSKGTRPAYYAERVLGMPE